MDAHMHAVMKIMGCDQYSDECDGMSRLYHHFSAALLYKLKVFCGQHTRPVKSLSPFVFCATSFNNLTLIIKSFYLFIAAY